MSPKNVGFLEAIKLYFKNYVNFTGRSTKSEYWWIVLFNFIVSFVLYMIVFATGGFKISTSSTSLYVGTSNPVIALWTLANLLPGISVTVRRLHDTGRAWYYYLMALIPLVGGILLLIMLLGDSEGDNAWGPCAYTLQTGGRPVYHTGQYNPNEFYNGAQQNTYDPNSFYGGPQQNNQYQQNPYGNQQYPQNQYGNQQYPQNQYGNQQQYPQYNQYGGQQQYPYQNQGGYNQYGAPQNYGQGQPGMNPPDQQGFGGNNVDLNKR